MTRAANSAIRLLAMLYLPVLVACPGWGTNTTLEYLEVALDPDGSTHLLTSALTSGEGGPISSDPLYAHADDGQLLDQAPGPESDAPATLLVDGAGRVLARQGLADDSHGLTMLDEGVWIPVEISAELDLTENERTALARLLSGGLGWIGDDGRARFVNYPDPYPTDHDEWYAEVEGGRVVTLRSVARALGPPPRLVDPAAPGGPRCLFATDMDGEELVSAHLVCDAQACAWELDPEVSLTIPAPLDVSTRLVHTTSAVPVLIRYGQTEDGLPATRLIWPAGEVSLEGPRELLTAVRRPTGGLALAAYQGHEARAVDLWLLDEDFEATRVEIDLGTWARDIALTASQPPNQPERIQVFWIHHMRVHCVEVDPATGDQTRWEVKL